jgi:hypothetical protein
MPWILAVCASVLVGGCFFKADYDGGTFTCSDSDPRCPSGLICHQGACLTSIPDAAIDALDAPPDTQQAALTCADPGIFPASGGTRSGTTAGRPSKMAASCGGFVNNGPDAVYRIDLAAGKMLRVAITSGALKAYVIPTCTETPPGTPACLGNTRALPGSPIVVTPAAGPSWVIVDEENAGATGGPYGLTLTVLN